MPPKVEVASAVPLDPLDVGVFEGETAEDEGLGF